MPKTYWITTYNSVKNPDALAAYGKLAGPAITAGGGRILVRGMPSKTYEGGQSTRTVVIEFESLERAVACHDSPAYQEALRALGTGSVERDMRFVEGLGVARRYSTNGQRLRAMAAWACASAKTSKKVFTAETTREAAPANGAGT